MSFVEEFSYNLEVEKFIPLKEKEYFEKEPKTVEGMVTFVSNEIYRYNENKIVVVIGCKLQNHKFCIEFNMDDLPTIFGEFPPNKGDHIKAICVPKSPQTYNVLSFINFGDTNPSEEVMDTNFTQNNMEP